MKTLFQRPDQLDEPLDVIVTVFNSPRFRNRWKLYEDFASRVEGLPSVRLWTVEVAFGRRAFAVTRPGHPRHLQLRTSAEIWHKERAQNLMLARVVAQYPEAKYIAFVDADISFARHDWADSARQRLQHYHVVQMWGEAYDLDADGHITQEHESFTKCYLSGLPFPGPTNYYLPKGGQKINWHPGYAWAWRREALDAVGGLIDFAILGSADFHMAHALVGNLIPTLNRGGAEAFNKNYNRRMRQWQRLAERGIRRNIGLVKGSIFHHYHGAKKDRQYESRYRILKETEFDPDQDLVRDSQGLYRLQHYGGRRSDALRDRVRAYFHQRDEDK